MTFKILLMAAIIPVLIGDSVRAEDCNLNDPTLLKPDLVALPPSRVRVLQRGNIRRVIFATKIANLGKGPLTIQGKTLNTPSGPVTQATQIIRRADGSECGYPAGTFEFHASHNHFHLNDFSSYELNAEAPLTGPLVAKSDKISFCVADIEPVRGFDTQRQVLAQCGTQEGIQGISVGWADVYDNYLPEQWIDVEPHVPAGVYYLTNVSDPDDLLLEVNEGHQSNAGSVSVSIPALIGWDSTPPTPTATTGGPAQPTPTATIGGIDPTPTSMRPVRTPVRRPPRLARPVRPTPIRIPRTPRS